MRDKSIVGLARAMCAVVLIGCALLGAQSSPAWVTGATSVASPVDSGMYHSIERDGRGNYMIAYIAGGFSKDEVWLKYKKNTGWVTAKLFEIDDFCPSTTGSRPQFNSVSVAVQHSVGAASLTNICVAASMGVLYDKYGGENTDRVMFVYEELTLSADGQTFTQGTHNKIMAEQGVIGTGSYTDPRGSDYEKANALRWFDPDSCMSQPTPVNNFYYADGTNNYEFAHQNGAVKVAYSGSTPWFACSVSGYVDHHRTTGPTNPISYQYEEHQALYLFKKGTPGTSWTPHTNNTTEKFEFEACEIGNADAPWIGPNWSFNLAADHLASADSAWVLAYRDRNFAGPEKSWAIGGYTGLDTRREVPDAHRSPHAVVWDGEPYIIYDAWETYYGDDPDQTPTCSEDYIMVEPLDLTDTGLGTGYIGLVCADDPGYKTDVLFPLNPSSQMCEEVVMYTRDVKYVGVSPDGEDLHIVSGPGDEVNPCIRHLFYGPKSADFYSPDHEDSPVDEFEDLVFDGVRHYFGDRVAVQTDGECAILVEEGEEDRRGDYDYEYRIAEGGPDICE